MESEQDDVGETEDVMREGKELQFFSARPL
jgi:hypothetical protein